jgi:hypothetical protein
MQDFGREVGSLRKNIIEISAKIENLEGNY